MKTLAKAIAISTLALAGPQVMAVELGQGFEGSGNIGAVTNYIWRGISQTRNDGAVQGGLDLTHSSGFYAGAWMSGVDFKLADQANTELDTYVGYGFTAGDFAFDLKYVDYHYASKDSLDFSEVHGHVSAYGVTVGADYSNDTPVTGASTATVDSSSAFHYYGSYSHALPEDITAAVTVGEYDYKDDAWVGGTDSKYTYYSVGLNKTMWGVNFGLAYTDSNIDANNCTTFMGSNDYCGDSFVASAVKTFK
jgi:uncharacterized protein (TIGR02001 family)